MPDGDAPYANGSVCRYRESSVLVFDKLSDALCFCESKVQQYPYMCCEIFDSKGKANPPLLVVMHPDAADRDEYRQASTRKRTILAALCLIGGPP